MLFRSLAIQAVQENTQFQSYLQSYGAAWGFVKKVIRDALPADVDGVDQLAYDLVVPVLGDVLGEESVHWETYQRESARGTATYVRRK